MVPEGLSNKFHTNIAKTGINTPKVKNWITSVKVIALIPPAVE